MCKFYTIAWKDLPWWMRAAFALNIAGIVMGTAFWTVVTVRVAVMGESITPVLAGITDTVLAPIFRMQEIVINAEREFHQMKLERQCAEFLSQALASCEKMNFGETDPDVLGGCIATLAKARTAGTLVVSTNDDDSAGTEL